MTTLQEARRALINARDDLHSCIRWHNGDVRRNSQTASERVAWEHQRLMLQASVNRIEDTLRTALAQQEADKPFQPDWVNYRQGVEDGKAEALLAQQGEQAKPAAYITDTEQGPMVWTPEMYDEACTYCDDGEFPVPLYTVAPRPTSGDYALGYAEGFNDACKPAPQAQERSTCNHCDGTGWVARDPDIGTDQECFVCDGSGYVKEEPAPQPAQGDRVTDKAWAQFCGLMGEKAPYPGMIDAFERHYAQSFKDKDWRNEASVWAQAWKAALQSAQPVAQPLSDSEIEKLREKTFSTYNPYCPVDSKSMRKAVRAAEAAHGIGEVK